MATEYNNPQLTKYQKDIIGTWVYETGEETMYIVTPKYVLYIPGKKMSYDRYVNGKVSPFKTVPVKNAYAITDQPGGYFFRGRAWWRIEGNDENMRLDNRRFVFRLGPIKLISYDGGGVLKKISDEETIKRLKDYDLDYEKIRKLPIKNRASISNARNPIPPENRDSRGFLRNVEDNSLPEVIEKFLEQNKK